MKVSRRVTGSGWLALLGGGEFSFEETEDADRAWLSKTRDGEVVFVPAASGSADYGRHFAVYLDEYFERRAELLPIYRSRDARRGKNRQRLAAASAVYLGGGVADRLIDAVRDTPVIEGINDLLAGGGVVVAIAASAQALGARVRSLFGGKTLDGLGLLPEVVIEPNFEPGHDRRLRTLLRSGGTLGLGIPAGSAVLVAPDGSLGAVGKAYCLESADGTVESLSALPSTS